MDDLEPIMFVGVVVSVREVDTHSGFIFYFLDLSWHDYSTKQVKTSDFWSTIGFFLVNLF